MRISEDGSTTEARRACRSCGYDLRGLVGDRCPECGTSTTESSAPPNPSIADRVNAWLLEEESSSPDAIMPPPASVPASDGGAHRCLACGYDLRGSTQSRCPECGVKHAPPRSPRRGRQHLLSDPPLCEEPRASVIALRNLLVVSAGPVLIALVGAAWFCLATAPAAMPQSIASLWWYFSRVVMILTGPFAPVALSMKLVLALLIATLWFAQHRLTRPIAGEQAARQSLGPTSRWRRVARGASGLHLLCLAAILLAILAPASAAAALLLRVTTALALIALFPFATHLRSHASWMRDDSAEYALHAASVGSLVGSLFPLLALAAGKVSAVDFLFVLPAGLGVLALFIGLAYGLGSLMRSAAWSVRHAAERDESAIRRQAERGAFDQKVRTLAQGTDPTGGRGRPGRGR